MVSSTSDAQPPHGLDLVIEFVNTFDAETGLDQLASTEGLRAWLVDRRLLDGDAPPVEDADRVQAIQLREALRSLMAAHNGVAVAEDMGDVLERAARQGRLSMRFATDGSPALAPLAGGYAAALATLLVPVAEAAAAGTWERVKACRDPSCRWAFYDRSRNRSGVWCDMAVCGNRTKVRAYRRRRPSAST
jgi:predicted RNA-binding Zn ribbon-like protein